MHRPSPYLSPSALDWRNIYSRGQLTIHNQKTRPDIVNNIWKKCRALSTSSDLTKELGGGELCLDEGCYGKAIVKSDVTFGIFPWQGAPWDSRHLTYFMLFEDRLWGLDGTRCKNREECRRVIQRKINHVTPALLDEERSLLSGSHMTSLDKVKEMTRKKKLVLLEQADFKDRGCMWWINKRYQTCTDENPFPEDVKKERAAWVRRKKYLEKETHTDISNSISILVFLQGHCHSA